jgi:hypothetical protein
MLHFERTLQTAMHLRDSPWGRMSGRIRKNNSGMQMAMCLIPAAGYTQQQVALHL